jgi:hypothetical protein
MRRWTNHLARLKPAAVAVALLAGIAGSAQAGRADDDNPGAARRGEHARAAAPAPSAAPPSQPAAPVRGPVPVAAAPAPRAAPSPAPAPAPAPVQATAPVSAQPGQPWLAAHGIHRRDQDGHRAPGASAPAPVLAPPPAVVSAPPVAVHRPTPVLVEAAPHAMPVLPAPGWAVPAPAFQPVADRGDWRDHRDGREGRGHDGPPPGAVVRVAPPAARVVPWGGVRYHYHEGTWYAPHSHGWVVVRPPVGVFVRELPVWRTVVVVGGLSYLVANDIYYQQRDDGYMVVAPPQQAPVVSTLVQPVDGLPRQFVYPRAGQTANQQASDEYECHRWAVGQTGFDPSAGAVGAAGGSLNQRDDYLRARAACLEGRNYTVR